MKKLVVVAHPHIEESIINKRWVEELEKYPDEFTVHRIYNHYPDMKIDVQKEQALIEQHDVLVLQYPLYWFNCPPLLKQWLDDVFSYGWAYGSKGNMLKGKKVALAISAGIRAVDFENEWGATVEQLTVPFRTTFRYTKSDFRGSYILHDTHEAQKDGRLEGSAGEYVEFIRGI